MYVYTYIYIQNGTLWECAFSHFSRTARPALLNTQPDALATRTHKPNPTNQKNKKSWKKTLKNKKTKTTKNINKNKKNKKQQFRGTPKFGALWPESPGILFFWFFWFSCNFPSRVAGFPRAASCAQGVCVWTHNCMFPCCLLLYYVLQRRKYHSIGINP